MYRIIITSLFKLYRILISPFLGNVCRFYPSCSEYAEEAFKKYGLFYGFWLSIRRLLRCQPYCAGGEDLLPMLQILTNAPYQTLIINQENDGR